MRYQGSSGHLHLCRNPHVFTCVGTKCDCTATCGRVGGGSCLTPGGRGHATPDERGRKLDNRVAWKLPKRKALRAAPQPPPTPGAPGAPPPLGAGDGFSDEGGDATMPGAEGTSQHAPVAPPGAAATSAPAAATGGRSPAPSLTPSEPSPSPVPSSSPKRESLLARTFNPLMSSATDDGCGEERRQGGAPVVTRRGQGDAHSLRGTSSLSYRFGEDGEGGSDGYSSWLRRPRLTRHVTSILCPRLTRHAISILQVRRGRRRGRRLRRGRGRRGGDGLLRL